MKNKVQIAIVGSDYQQKITDSLLEHCLATLKKQGVAQKQITVVRVPGSLEIPLAVKKLAQKGVFDAIIALGVIHKGDTYHFELISHECARGCMDVALQYEVPVIFEVLAVYDLQDALERATGKKENRGVEAAMSAIKMIGEMRRLS